MVQGTAQKTKSIERVKELIKKYSLVGVVNMHSLPTAQLQRMRKKMTGDVEIFMTKKRLMKLALEDLKKDFKGIEQLEEKLNGVPALLFTNENPFKLYGLLQKNKSKAAAKGGQIAPNDIIISAGLTQFTPGPIISELGSYGLKTSVKDGKIEILKDAVVVKEGDEISSALAAFLVKMAIEPMEIGLDLVCVYEDGNLYGKEILAIDENEYTDNFTNAHRWAINLAMEAGVLTDVTAELTIQKLFREAKAVAIEGSFMTSETTDEILGRADRAGRVLDAELDLPEAGAAPAEDSSAKAEETEAEQAPTTEDQAVNKKEQSSVEEKEN